MSERKTLCGLLSKLYFPDDVEDWQVKALSLLSTAIQTVSLYLFMSDRALLLTLTTSQTYPLTDATSKNAFNRFQVAFTKKFGTQLSQLDEEAVMDTEEVREIQALLGSAADVRADAEATPIKPRPKK